MFGISKLLPGASEAVTSGQLLQALAAPAKHRARQRVHLPFIMFQVSMARGEITGLVAAAMRIIQRPGCICETNLSTVMFVTFPETQGIDNLQLRDRIAEELMGKLGNHIRLIKGSVNAVLNPIGRGEDSRPGCAFAGIERLFGALFTRPFGTCATLERSRRQRSTAA